MEKITPETGEKCGKTLFFRQRAIELSSAGAKSCSIGKSSHQRAAAPPCSPVITALASLSNKWQKEG